MRKFGKLLSTIFMSVVAIGMVSAAITTKNNGVSLVNQDIFSDTKAANADDVDYFYFTVSTNWHNASSGTASFSDFKNHQIYINGSSGYDTWKKIEDIANAGVGASIFEYKGLPIFKCPKFGGSSIRVYADYWAGTAGNNYSVTSPFPTSTSNPDGLIPNMFVINSHRTGGAYDNNQTGFWIYFDENTQSNIDSTISDTDTLFFVPNYDWSTMPRYYEYCWPYLVVKDSSSNVLYEAAADGFLETSIDRTKRTGSNQSSSIERMCWYFRNVPVNANINKMLLYHNHNTSNGDVYYGAINVSDWYNAGKHVCTLFGNNGTQKSRSESNVIKGFEYYRDSSLSFLRGSFAENTDVTTTFSTAATSSSCGGVFVPDYASAFKYDSDLKKSFITFDVDANDSFVYCGYDKLYNNSSTGYASSWGYVNSETYGYTSSYLIYDEVIGDYVDTDDYGLYVTNGSLLNSKASIKFVKGGRIELRRESTSYGTASLIITFKSSGRSAILATDPKYVKGTFNGEDSGDYNSFEYNYSTGRYETYVTGFVSDRFQVWTNSSNLNLSKSSFSGDTTYLSDGTGSDSGWIVITGLGLYRLEWYPYNNNPTGASDRQIAYYITKVSPNTDSDVAYKSGVALGKRTSLYTQICQNDYTSETSSLKSLYNSFGSTQFVLDARDSGMESVVFKDYDYTEYVFNGKSYEGLTPTVNTNGLYKYEWLNYLYGGGPYPAHALGSTLLLNNEEYKESNTIIVIVIASTSLLAIASLAVVNFLAIKKRKQKR